MGGQVWTPKQTDEEAVRKKREEVEKAAALWRTQQLLQSVMPNNSGRIIDWRQWR